MWIKRIKLLVVLGIAILILVPLAKAGENPQTSLLIVTFQTPPVLSSKKEIRKLVDFAQASNIKTLFMQVYRANQSWFPSAVADQAPYISSEKSVGSDPLALLIKESHENGIKVFAWLNLLSLGKNSDALILKKYGVDILTRNTQEKKTLSDYKIDDQYFLEPGDMRVRGELSTIVEEIVKRYPDLDGILFDYIRYPDVKPSYGYTQNNIARFKESTGSLVLGERNMIWRKWKRDQVTGLLASLVKKVRRIRPSISVAATGCVSYSRAYEESFQDWPSWINRGVVDFVALMNYPADVDEFSQYINEVKEKVDDFRKVHIAVGAYKLAKIPDVFKRQLLIVQGSGSGGSIIFHYGSLLDDPVLRGVFDRFQRTAY